MNFGIRIIFPCTRELFKLRYRTDRIFVLGTSTSLSQSNFRTGRTFPLKTRALLDLLHFCNLNHVTFDPQLL